MIYLLLFFSFLKIGAFTFGGGHAMIPLIQEEVIKHDWMTLEELINFIAISESTPGPFAINIATFVGFDKGGILGALLTTIGVIIVSFIIILFVAKYLDRYKENKIVKYCMTGLQPVIIGLIGAAIISIGKVVLFPNENILSTFTTDTFWKTFSIFIVMFVMALKKINSIKIILISSVLGILLGIL